MSTTTTTLLLSFSLFTLLFLTPSSAAAAASQKLWCVAKNNADDASLQRAIDWACGAGGADCSPIQQGRSCYDPNNFQATATYAFNDYFTKHGDDASCDFGNTAALSSLDPSHGDCKLPYSVQAVSNGGFVASANGVGPASPNYSGCDNQIGDLWVQALITAVGFVLCKSV
ncbi:hypothetical protein Scep_011541 [Stephania cephalantha]|uniref:X8 domain-containing protein n=1 Tax=Stephania cephalantha TaxID=152367 RepID=A0AAP0JDJ9_9MAGN